MDNNRITEDSITPQAEAQPIPAPQAPIQAAPPMSPPVMQPVPQPVQPKQPVDIDAKMAELDAKIAELDRAKEEMEAATQAAISQNGKLFNSKSSPADSQRHKAKAETIKAKLAQQPKVKVFVPLQGSEKRGQMLPVTINGYTVNVPKGVYVDVPEQIGTIVADSLNQTVAAEIDNPYNLSNAPEFKKEQLAG